jgi:hypothetical protein
MAAQLTATKGWSLRGLLARPGLAGEEHGGVGAGHPLDQLVDLAHRQAAADQVLVAHGRVPVRAQALDLLGEGPVLGRPLEREAELIHLDRFADEVVGLRPHGRHRGLVGAEGADHHDRDIRTVGRHPLAQGQPIHPAHAQVGQHHVHLVLPQPHQGLLAPLLAGDLEAAAGKPALQGLTERQVVINDQYASAHDTGLRCPRAEATQ